MNKLKIALTLAVLPIFIHADGELVMTDKKNMSQAEQPMVSFIEYHNRIAVFTPCHQVYERIKPNAYYGGIEFFAEPIVSSKLSHGKLSDGLFANGEVRFGYNLFYNNRDHVTPFMGAGFTECF